MIPTIKKSNNFLIVRRSVLKSHFQKKKKHFSVLFFFNSVQIKKKKVLFSKNDTDEFYIVNQVHLAHALILLCGCEVLLSPTDLQVLVFQTNHLFNVCFFFSFFEVQIL